LLPAPLSFWGIIWEYVRVAHLQGEFDSRMLHHLIIPIVFKIQVYNFCKEIHSYQYKW
jgi:hypothetical protein